LDGTSIESDLLALCSGWHPVEARIHEVHADYCSLVAAKMDILCTNQQQQGPFVGCGTTHHTLSMMRRSTVPLHRTLSSLLESLRRRSDGWTDALRRRKGGRSSFEVRFLLCGGSSSCAPPLVLRFCWRLVEARIHELHADYSTLVAARTNILCTEQQQQGPFVGCGTTHCS
jgi:hypothetical protein